VVADLALFNAEIVGANSDITPLLFFDHWCFFRQQNGQKRGGVGIGIGSHRISRKFMEQEKMHGLPQIPGFFLLILQRNPDIRRRRYPFLFYDSLSIEYIRNVVIKISGRKIQKK